MRQALGLWQSTPLAGATAAYVPGMRAQMEAQRLAAYERLAELELELGRHADLATELPSVVAAHPTRERLRAALMLAHIGAATAPTRLIIWYRHSSPQTWQRLPGASATASISMN
ncbi:MAG TPA: BTAD domain-containing putative transcriptional regulator [Candidatus Limnocylindrales bacterium]